MSSKGIGSLVLLTLTATSLTLYQNCSGSSALNASSRAVSSMSSSSSGDDGGDGSSTSSLGCVYSKTNNGPSAQLFVAGERVYGRCKGFSATGVRGCVEIVGLTDYSCNNPNVGFTDLPNPGSAPYDWKKEGNDYVAEFVIPSDWAGKTFKGFTYNSQTFQMSTPLYLTVAGSGSGGGGGSGTTPHCVYSKTNNGPSAQTFMVGERVYGRCKGFAATGVKGCVEIVGVTDNACSNPNSGYTNLPNPSSAPYDWKLVGSDYVAEFVIPSDWAGKAFKGFTYNSATSFLAAPLYLNVSSGSTGVGQCSFIYQSGPQAVIGPCTAPTFTCNTSTANQSTSITCGNGVVGMKCTCY